MTSNAILRSLAGALVAFLVLYVLLALILGGAVEVGSDSQYFFIGAAALLAPMAGTMAGAWQARAAGATRPLQGVGVGAVLVLLLSVVIFFTNDTAREGFNTLQKLLPLIGIVVGGGFYLVRWFGTTSARR